MRVFQTKTTKTASGALIICFCLEYMMRFLFFKKYKKRRADFDDKNVKIRLT